MSTYMPPAGHRTAVRKALREEWRPIDFAPRYEVSNLGRIRSWVRRNTIGRPVVLTPTVNQRAGGYLRVSIWVEGQRKTPTVHRLVAHAFLGPEPAGMQVRHLDGDPLNNALANLIYGTPSENRLDTVRHGRHPWANKTHCPQGHEYTQENTRIYRGSRYCRACTILRHRQLRARRRAERQALYAPSPP